MSFEAVLWATSDAPIANVNEFAVLVMLAEKADSDGCAAFPSRATVASRTTIDPRTVQRTLRDLATRKLIGPGDKRAAAYIRADRRPPVWDLLIPYGWFPNIERINKERAEKGKQPLTWDNRPAIAAPPEKRERSDKGKKRPRKQEAEADPAASETSDGRGDFKSPRDERPLQGHGETVTPERGDSESETGRLEVSRTSPYEPVQEPVLPSVSAGHGEGDGGKDGSQVPRQIGRNPGVELLLAIGAEQPEFLLTGKTLQDQGLPLAGMLLDGWTPEQLRQVIAGRPLPDPIRTTVGAVISSRIRDALSGPAPSSARGSAGSPAGSGEVDPQSARLSSPAQPKSVCRECPDPIFLVGPAVEDGLCTPCRRKGAAVRVSSVPELPVDLVAQARASVLASKGKNRVTRMP